MPEILKTIIEVSKTISAELDLDKLVQKITDAGTKISGARFGAFFYNVTEPSGTSYMLYSISGVPREAFSKFPMPRGTALFRPTIEGTAIIVSDDVTKDERYGKNAPFFGMPPGHLPVRSYLAVPVVARRGEVIGALFFGHEERGVFKEDKVELISGLAAHVAVAIDNARLYKKHTEAIQLRDDFLSIASHELKTPLTSLKLQLELSARTAPESLTPEKMNRTVRRCLEQTRRLTDLVEDLLDVSQIQSGRLSYRFESFNLGDLVAQCVERFEEHFRNRNCPLQFTTAEQVWVNADRFRIDQVVENLLSNALKYGESRPIEVRVLEAAEDVTVSVRDYGRGIPLEQQERIFERFTQGAENSIHGLGLGLFISQEIVRAHRSRIEVQSRPLEGATFSFRLPRLAIC